MPPLSLPTPPRAAAEKRPTLSASPPCGFPSQAEPLVRPSLNSPAQTPGKGAPPGHVVRRGWGPKEGLGGGEAGQEGPHPKPQLLRGSRDCAPPSAPTGPRVATCSLALHLPPSLSPIRVRRSEEAVAPQEPYVNPGVGWGGGGKRRRGNKPLWLE